MYLVQTDFSAQITTSELTTLLNQSPTPTTVLQRVIGIALDEVVSHLSGRYMLDEEFAKEGEARNRLLVARMVDLALYHLFSLVAPRQTPDLRRDRYAEAVELLKGAGKGTRFLQLPVIPTVTPTGEQGYYLSDSRPKFTF